MKSSTDTAMRKNPFAAGAILLTLFVAGFFVLLILTVVAGGIANLPQALASREIRFSIGLSLWTASASTILCILMAMPVAYALTRLRLPCRRLIEVVLELPLSLPHLILGFSLLIIFSSSWGKALRDAGFPVVFNAAGVIIAQIAVNLPLAIRLIRTAFSEVDLRLELIAGTLGATWWKRFLTITLPLSWNAILSAVVLVWSRALGEFGAALMLAGVTRMKTETLAGSIFLNVSAGNNNMALAAATLLLFISALSLGLTGLLNRSGKHTRIKEDDRIW